VRSLLTSCGASSTCGGRCNAPPEAPCRSGFPSTAASGPGRCARRPAQPLGRPRGAPASDGLAVRGRRGRSAAPEHGGAPLAQHAYSRRARGDRLHDLRHFYASGLIAAGCGVVTVRRALARDGDHDPGDLQPRVAVRGGPDPSGRGDAHGGSPPFWCGQSAGKQRRLGC
jgi:hypothetical protein